MSATVFLVTHDRLLALSDGQAVDYDFNTVATDERKVFKVSEQALILSFGNVITDTESERNILSLIQEHAKKAGITTPGDVADLVRRYVKIIPAEADMLNYGVLGFDNSGSPEMISFTNDNRSGEWQQLSPGNIGLMAHECAEKVKAMFEVILNDKYQHGNGQPIEDAALQAWTETIRHYEKDNYFGGSIFAEGVKPKRLTNNK